MTFQKRQPDDYVSPYISTLPPSPKPASVEMPQLWFYTHPVTGCRYSYTPRKVESFRKAKQQAQIDFELSDSNPGRPIDELRVPASDKL